MTDYEVLGVNNDNTMEEIHNAYLLRLSQEEEETQKARINLAYQRLMSIKPTKPCPKIKHEDIIYMAL